MNSSFLADPPTDSLADAPNAYASAPARKRLETLRSSIDIRLAALETALEDPSSNESLAGLILELARAATEEAQLTAASACADTRLEADIQIAQIRAAAQAALDQERAGAAELRRALDQARGQAAALERTLVEERSRAATAQEQLRDSRRVVGDLQTELARARTAHADVRRISDETREELEATAQREADARAALDEARQASDTEARAREALEVELDAERVTVRELRLAVTASDARVASAIEEERRGTEALRESQARAEARAAALTNDLETLRTAHGQVVGELERVQTRAAELEREQAEFRHEAALTEAQVAAVIDENQRTIADLRSALSRSDARIAALTQDLSTANSSRDRLAAELDRERWHTVELERAYSELREALATADARLTAAVEDERANTVGVRDQLARSDARAAAAAREAAEAAASRDRLTAELESEQARASDLERAYALLKQTVDARVAAVVGEERASTSTLRDALAQSDARAAAVIQDLTAAHAARERIAAELTRERARAEASEQTAAQLRDVSTATQAALDAERAAATSLRRALDEARQTLERTTGDVAALTHERERARAQTVDADQALAEARAEARNLQEELERVRGRIETLAGERADLERALRSTESRLGLAERERDALARDLESARLPATTAEEPLQDTAGTPEAGMVSGNAQPAVPGIGTEGPPRPRTHAATQEAEWTEIRLFTRYRIADGVEVQVNGGASRLHDLSVGGCQLLSSTPLKPNQPVKVLLPSEGQPVLCTGKVVWARLESSARGRSSGYRAGVQFTRVDEATVEAFIISHGVTS